MTNTQNSYKKSSFGPAFFFLSSRRRAALADYYEFCRLMDDIADEPREHPLKELADWEEEVQRMFVGTAQTMLGKRLQQDVQAFHITKDRFLLLIEGMRDDLNGKKYPTFDALNEYLHRVAVVVGQGTLDILGIKGTQADALAWALGSAVQLTNIVRDVAQDAQLGRVYLPGNFTPQQILAEGTLPQIKELLQEAAQRAYQRYEEAFALMKCFPRFKMLPCRIMGYVYLKNLAKIEKSGFYNEKPIKLSKLEKIQMVFYGILKTFF
ncbi:MAG: squalene/phytoene synthase family protein [Elusimicrobiaceae bacterium]|nr:squalene/phytoene synthase family protein [Elusimicrobiaceae bacterium]